MQYQINKKNDSLTVFTKQRLNFEPKDWRKDLKRDIIAALNELKPTTKPYFRAILQTANVSFFDIENVLFYNVGTSNFKGVDMCGVWFFIEKNNELKEWESIHFYEFVNQIEPCTNSIIAEWHDIVIDKPNTVKKPLDYWIALKKADNIVVHMNNYNKEFGLYLIIKKPKTEIINIINIQKPLIDGVISAFHKPVNIIPEVVEYISTRIGCHKEFIEKIINNSSSCLSDREVIQRYRSGIKWNPQDENCIDVRIVVEDSDDDLYRLSGYIFEK